MIRFIDLRDEGTGNNFAFFDTVKNRFLEFGGVAAWEDFADFKDGCSYEFEEDQNKIVERCIRLCPPWTHT